jgi:acyl carrier protein
MMDEIRDQLAELLRTKTGESPAGDDPLAALKIDSLAMAELTVEIERTFDIKVDEAILDVVTVNDMVAYVYERTQSKLRPSS